MGKLLGGIMIAAGVGWTGWGVATGAILAREPGSPEESVFLAIALTAVWLFPGLLLAGIGYLVWRR